MIPQTSWGNITGTLSNQTDLFNALSNKANSSHTHTKSEITDFSHNHDERYYTEDEIDSKLNSKLNSSLKGVNNGIAELDSTGKVPSSQLPSYVDDVLEFNSQSNFPSTGEAGKIYIAKDTNKTYRWSGTNYVEISTSLALGETSSTAYRGDRGKIAYDHSQTSHAPSNAEVNQNAFSNVKVGSTTIAADSKTDTLELVAGTNVILTPDATNDKVTITAAAYTHPSYTARTGVPTANQTPAFGGTFSVNQINSDATGHVTAANSRTVTIPSTLSNGTETAGLIKTSSTVTSNSGYTACPVINGVPYYKDTETTVDNSLIARKNARIEGDSLIITNDTTTEDIENLLNYLKFNTDSIVIYGNGDPIVTIAKTADDSGHMKMNGTSMLQAQESMLSTIRLRSADGIGNFALVAGSDGHVSLKEVLN